MPVHQLYEEMELHYPRYRLMEENIEVVVAGPEKGKVYEGKHGYPVKTNASFNELSAKDFDGIIIAGGYAPDKLRIENKLLELIRSFHEKKKLIGFICHAGWVPVSAGIIEGVKCTSYKTIKDDMINAGANWVDQEVVIDGHFITSRSPADLPVFAKAILEFLTKQYVA